MKPAVLELTNVTKLYGDFRAVDDVSLTIPEGSVYGFLGPNGAGKTTTLRMILEILRPTSGSIAVFGHSSALEVRERIGYLPEEKGLYKKMRAWSIIAYFAMLKGLDRKTAKRRAYELLERYGLGKFADQKTEALSKGMGQKVQVLAAIAHEPDLVILDEPFSGLDPVNQQVMEEVIRDMRSQSKTVLFSTHVMSHAERVCDRMLLIAGGKKIFDGTIAEAKRTIPRRVRVQSPDDLAALRGLAGVRSMTAVAEDGTPLEPQPAAGTAAAAESAGVPPGEPPIWELQLDEALDAQAILAACFERGIRLLRFDQTDPSLHDVFVKLVGPEAREASYR